MIAVVTQCLLHPFGARCCSCTTRHAHRLLYPPVLLVRVDMTEFWMGAAGGLFSLGTHIEIGCPLVFR